MIHNSSGFNFQSDPNNDIILNAIPLHLEPAAQFGNKGLVAHNPEAISFRPNLMSMVQLRGFQTVALLGDKGIFKECVEVIAIPPALTLFAKMYAKARPVSDSFSRRETDLPYP